MRSPQHILIETSENAADLEPPVLADTLSRRKDHKGRSDWGFS